MSALVDSDVRRGCPSLRSTDPTELWLEAQQERRHLSDTDSALILGGRVPSRKRRPRGGPPSPRVGPALNS